MNAAYELYALGAKLTRVTDCVLVSAGSYFYHECYGPDSSHISLMKQRNNEDGPNYWCQNCGYVLPQGESIALRLFELRI